VNGVIPSILSGVATALIVGMIAKGSNYFQRIHKRFDDIDRHLRKQDTRIQNIERRVGE